MLKFFWRTITRHKGYTLINALGLSLGITACLVIYLITSYEFSFDRHHPDSERIYRVGGRFLENEGSAFAQEVFMEAIPAPAPATIRQEIPNCEVVVGFYPYRAKVSVPTGNGTVPSTNGSFTTTNANGPEAAIITEPSYFSIFHYTWLAGSPASLAAPFSVVLTANQARQYFGPQSPQQYLGRQLIYDDSLRVNVTGIIADWKQHTDLAYTAFISFSTIDVSVLKKDFHPGDWRVGHENQWIGSFVKLHSSDQRKRTEGQMTNLVQRHMRFDPMIQQVHFSLVLQPLSDIHFNEAYSHDGMRKARLPVLYGLMGAALFVLLLAIVNFINLSTASSLQRAKEVGVRKVLGGGKTQLTLRFLAETGIITLLATLLALLLVYPTLSLFRDYIPNELEPSLLQPSLIVFIPAVILVTTVLAGYYPARVLSGLAPALSLKGTGPANHSGRLRKILIVFQFTISLLFVIGAIVMQRQISFMLKADTGLSTDAVVTIYNWDAPYSRMQLLSERLKQLPGIKDNTLEAHTPIGKAIMDFSISYEDSKLMVSLQAGGANYIPFYGMKLLAGHNLQQTDSAKEFVINATYCHALGFKKPDDAIGKLLSWNGQSYTITGVVADFHESSFHQAIRPLVIAHVPAFEIALSVRLATAGKKAGDLTTALQQLERQFKAVFPDRTFGYQFLDESIAQLYQQDRQAAWLINAATAITIFISCMGLVGLLLFIVEKRKKEISIRKVLGAGIADIAVLLNKEFLQLIGLALLIASPLAWWAMNRWLENYAYRIRIDMGTFALAGLATITIAFLTIGFQVVKAALVAPAKNLRSE